MLNASFSSEVHEIVEDVDEFLDGRRASVVQPYVPKGRLPPKRKRVCKARDQILMPYMRESAQFVQDELASKGLLGASLVRAGGAKVKSRRHSLNASHTTVQNDLHQSRSQVIAARVRPGAVSRSRRSLNTSMSRMAGARMRASVSMSRRSMVQGDTTQAPAAPSAPAATAGSGAGGGGTAGGDVDEDVVLVVNSDGSDADEPSNGQLIEALRGALKPKDGVQRDDQRPAGGEAGMQHAPRHGVSRTRMSRQSSVRRAQSPPRHDDYVIDVFESPSSPSQHTTDSVTALTHPPHKTLPDVATATSTTSHARMSVVHPARRSVVHNVSSCAFASGVGGDGAGANDVRRSHSHLFALAQKTLLQPYAPAPVSRSSLAASRSGTSRPLATTTAATAAAAAVAASSAATSTSRASTVAPHGGQRACQAPLSSQRPPLAPTSRGSGAGLGTMGAVHGGYTVGDTVGDNVDDGGGSGNVHSSLQFDYEAFLDASDAERSQPLQHPPGHGPSPPSAPASQRKLSVSQHQQQQQQQQQYVTVPRSQAVKDSARLAREVDMTALYSGNSNGSYRGLTLDTSASLSSLQQQQQQQQQQQLSLLSTSATGARTGADGGGAAGTRRSSLLPPLEHMSPSNGTGSECVTKSASMLAAELLTARRPSLAQRQRQHEQLQRRQQQHEGHYRALQEEQEQMRQQLQQQQRQVPLTSVGAHAHNATTTTTALYNANNYSSSNLNAMPSLRLCKNNNNNISSSSSNNKKDSSNNDNVDNDSNFSGGGGNAAVHAARRSVHDSSATRSSTRESQSSGSEGTASHAARQHRHRRSTHGSTSRSLKVSEM